VKNYLSDVRKFIHWFEGTFAKEFAPWLITTEIVKSYKSSLNSSDSQTKVFSARSLKRYISSLSKFYQFLISQKLTEHNPFEIDSHEPQQKDFWYIKEFTNHLFLSHASNPTIKNYIMDINQFKDWTTRVNVPQIASQIPTAPLETITPAMIEEYKSRLLNDAGFSAVSVNRKLSSLRKYFSWCASQGFLKQQINFAQVADVSKDIKIPQDNTPTDASLEALARVSQAQPAKQSPTYSQFPPLRMIQKLAHGSSYIFDLLVLLPVVKLIVAGKYAFWKMTGAQIFAPLETMIDASKIGASAAAGTALAGSATALDSFVTQRHQSSFGSITNVPKALYAPLEISTKGFPLHAKIIHHLRYTRPKWYKTYHSYAFVHYLHFAVFLVYATILGLTIYQAAMESPLLGAPVMAALPGSPPRMLAFEGTLTDETNTPITAEQPLRFSLYNNATATGSALLWQETQVVTPDHDGNFSTMLGKTNPIYQKLLSDNPTLYLGISIGDKPELLPRQQIATTAYSQDSERVQGLLPITDPDADTRNVILALNSSGDLTIGGTANPRFEATGGELTLSGRILTLTTAEDSNANIQLNPDGNGIIDAQKPLQNTTNYSIGSGMEGMVQVADSLGIVATSSSQPALLINQNSTGNLISAVGLGSAKFTVDYVGTGMFAGDVAVNGNNLTSDSLTFNLLNNHVLDLNIGSDASSISLGASYGATMINNSLTVDKTTTLNGPVSTNGLLTANAGITIPEEQHVTFSGLTPGGIAFLDNNKQFAQDSTALFWQQDTKRLGIGTNAPGFKLDVQDNLAGVIGTRTSIVQIYNADTGTTSDGLTVKLGNINPTTDNSFISFVDGTNHTIGKITGTGGGNVAYTTPGEDYAEYYKKADLFESFEQGDVVCFGPNNGVTKCKDNANILGIVSATAGFIGGGNHDSDPSYVLVGIVGQLPVKIGESSEAFQSGDPVALGPDGLIKATKPGIILGHVLESYNPTQNTSGMVRIALNITWNNTGAQLSDSGNLETWENEQPEPTTGLLAGTMNQIKSALIEAGNISTQTLSIATDKITIGDQSLGDYVASIVQDTLKNTQNQLFAQKIISPLAEVNQVRTNIISPLASDSDVALQFDRSHISVINTKASSSALATIDDQGNARFAGDIEARRASFSGTLRARRIIADEIEGLNIQAATLSANYITNITNVYNTIATPSATPTPDTQLATTTPASDQFTSLPSESLAQTGTPTFSAEFAKFNQGLISLGPTSLTDVGISGKLRLGQSMIISDTGINTIGADLSLQSLRQGNILLMGDRIKIDTEGNLAVGGNAVFAKDVIVSGKFAASLIVPVPNQDLLFQLPTGKDGKASKFQIQTGTGSAVLTVNQAGDIIGSGSGRFNDVAAKAFTIIRGAQADTSFTTTVSDGSAGIAVISTNETERTIVSPFMKEDSLVYITATSDTQGVTPYIARQTKDSFTIQIPHIATKDIKINWWIVN